MSNVCEMPLFGVHTHQVRAGHNMRKLFHQARDEFPSLVFLDDVDAIFSDQNMEPSCNHHVQNLREELFQQLGPRKLKIYDPDSLNNPTKTLLSSPEMKSKSNTDGGGATSSRASSRASSMARPSAPPHEAEADYDDDDTGYPDNNGIIVVAATSSPWLLYKVFNFQIFFFIFEL